VSGAQFLSRRAGILSGWLGSLCFLLFRRNRVAVILPGRHMARFPTDPRSRGFAFPIVVAVLVVGFSLPVVLSDHLPMQDIPNHLAIVQTLAGEGSDAAWGERFENRLAPDAYSAYYAVGVFLARQMGAEAANRVMVALYAVLLPLTFLALVLAYDPDRRWNVVPAFLLIYSDLYLVGFANYLLSLPMLLGGAALGIRIARGDGRSWPSVVALAVIGIALYFTHPLSLGMLFVVLAVLVPWRGPGRRRLLALGAGLLPGFALLLGRLPAGGFTSGPFHRVGLWLKVRYLLTTPLFALDAHRHWSFYVAGALGLLFAGLVAYDLIRRRRGRGSAGPASRSLDRPLLGAGLFVALYFAAPFNAGNATWLDLRLSVTVWLLLLLALRPRLTDGSLRRGVLVAVSAVSLLGVWSLHRAFDREIAPLFDVIERMRPSARVLPIAVETSSDACRPFYSRDAAIPCYATHAHFGAYYNVERGGVNPFMTFHASLDWIPLGLRDPFYRTGFNIAEPFFPALLVSNLPRTAGHFDYILVRGLHPEALRWIETYGRPVTRRGEFAAFAVRDVGSRD
jgi:hypothetical protein